MLFNKYSGMNKFEVWQLIYIKSEDGSQKLVEKTTKNTERILVLNFGLSTNKVLIDSLKDN